MAHQVSTFPPGEIKVAAEFADGRYLIACSTEEGSIDYAYLGLPGAMKRLKAHADEVFEDGKTFDVTISIGNLHFDSQSKELVFEWFKTGQNEDSYEINKAINKEIEWAEMLKHVEIDETLRSRLFE